ncbi:MAG: DEAD/DEAH box helicase [Planctomycetes bacterium]|nr:DEAD/DEAH box helicase [Planctomycetota bacterium]
MTQEPSTVSENQPNNEPANIPTPGVDDAVSANEADSKPVHAPHGKGEVFDDVVTFESMGLRNSVLKGIASTGFTKPTKTQSMLMPAIMAGKDVLGQAKTGTGKTAAFGLPLLHGLERDKQFQALILAPTRELAIQITAELEELGQHTPIKPVCLFGGQAVRQQAGQLQRGGGQIVVGTPGRVMDMLERRFIHFNDIKTVILDEVDRMLDIGFRDDIRKILEKIPQKHQTVFVSATISPDIERLARKFMHEPEKIIVASGSLTVSLVEQHYISVNPWDKRRLLVHILKSEEPALTLVFCRLKRVVDELCALLNRHNIDAHAIHGDMPQGKRNSTMRRLRDGQLSVLVCSDLASRGIDVDDVSHVINYDLPEDSEVYVHRIGRTARAGRKGIAWSLVTPSQGELLTSIELLINAEIPAREYPDFIPSDPPPGYRDPDERKQQGGLTLASAPEAKPAAPIVNRIAAAANLELPARDSADATKFPGGLVPTKLPPRRMHGRIPSGRRGAP